MMAAPQVPESTAEGKLVIVQQAEGGPAAAGTGDAETAGAADEAAMAIDGYDDDDEEEDGGAVPMRMAAAEEGAAALAAASEADEAEYTRLRTSAEVGIGVCAIAYAYLHHLPPP